MRAHHSQFQRIFCESYKTVRNSYGLSAWQDKWSSSHDWSNLMLYDNNAVIRDVADKLGMNVAGGEPMRLDAVFKAKEAKDRWYPIQIAVEHENDPWTICNEIHSLFSVRSPLKVAITYCLKDQKKSPDKIMRWITRKICEECEAILAVVGEDLATEYLFLIGKEYQLRELEWHSLSFTAGQGPKDIEFRRIE